MGRTFERHPDPAYQLLNAWSTDYVTVRQLISCLQTAGLLREASLIHGLVLDDDPSAIHPTTPTDLVTPDSSSSADPLHVPFTRLQRWTSDFSEGCLLGRGGFANVFKGSRGIIAAYFFCLCIIISTFFSLFTVLWAHCLK